MKYRLCVDDRWTPAHGISRYGSELLARLSERFELRRIAQDCAISDPLSPWRLSKAIRQSGADLFWSPGFIPPAHSPIPFVFTLHDLGHIHIRGRFRTAYFNHLIRPLSRAAYRIVTVSEFSRTEICEWTSLDPGRVVVVSNGVSTSYSPHGPRYNPGYPYLLYVGNHLPHKNLKRALMAFAVSGLKKDLRMVLTGGPDAGLADIVASLGISQQVIFAGRIAEAGLPAYYRGAAALVLVSTHEGFGLPVAEAMACGTPVLAANVASLPEVAGGAALLVDPLRVDAIADGMRKIVTDAALRETCRVRGLEQSRRFDWDQSAAKLSAILTGMAANR